MAFRLSYLEVLSFAETLLVSIIRTLQTDPKYRPLIAAVRQEYPSAGILRLPFPGEDVLRVSFSEARAMLKQAGLAERADMSDLRYVRTRCVMSPHKKSMKCALAETATPILPLVIYNSKRTSSKKPDQSHTSQSAPLILHLISIF